MLKEKKDLTVFLLPADGNPRVVGDSRCVVCGSTLGHHLGHPAGAAGARHSNVSDVEGAFTRAFWSVCYSVTLMR